MVHEIGMPAAAAAATAAIAATDAMEQPVTDGWGDVELESSVHGYFERESSASFGLGAPDREMVVHPVPASPGFRSPDFELDRLSSAFKGLFLSRRDEVPSATQVSRSLFAGSFGTSVGDLFSRVVDSAVDVGTRVAEAAASALPPDHDDDNFSSSSTRSVSSPVSVGLNVSALAKNMGSPSSSAEFHDDPAHQPDMPIRGTQVPPA
ncbi:MAG: hypothetical protein EOO65_03540, partial [Methanosarcinales archaeon]